jgi:protein-tyrosine phosphatase
MTLHTAGKRRVNLRGCFNFRDLGGYRTDDGMQSRYGRLYRSDGLQSLTSTDQVDLARLNLATVIDLRTPRELAEDGRARVETTQHLLPMADVLPAEFGAHGWHAEPATLAESYFAMLTSSVETIREILAVLSDRSSYPAVLCCASGVERTGVVTAVILGLLGVTDGVIVSDFAGSREAVLRRIGRLRFEHPSVVSRDLDRYGTGLLGVVPEAIGLFLERVREEHEGFAGYARAIDMSGAVPYIRAALLERGLGPDGPELSLPGT